MNSSSQSWAALLLLGFGAPVLALVMFAGSFAGPFAGSFAGPFAGSPSDAAPLQLTASVLALGMMASGMIGGAIAASLWAGVMLALVNGACLLLIAHLMGAFLSPSLLPSLLPIGFAMIIASISFAARGSLFAQSALDKGWLIALFVVAGEAAILITALARPNALPDWLLVLLPAQWASLAFQSGLLGEAASASVSVLIALAGTAAATMLVKRLWPRRWPYLVMFTTWLGLAALVWHWP